MAEQSTSETLVFSMGFDCADGPGGGTEDVEARWVTVFHDDGSVETTERPGYADSIRQKELDAWGGGEPIPEASSYNAGQELTRNARDLVVGILASDDATARRVAVWCARTACEYAGLAHRSWVAPALDDLEHGRPPGHPFANHTDAFERLRAEFASGETNDDGGAGELRVGSAYAAIPSVFAARDPDGRRAAMNAFSHAYFAFGARAGNAAELNERLRHAFPDLPR